MLNYINQQEIAMPTTEQLAKELGVTPEVISTQPHLKWQDNYHYIKEIKRLKKEKNATILAHNYQNADIVFGVADVVGDSLMLCYEAAKAKGEMVVVAGVYFMAEAAKVLNPDKVVLMPEPNAGCSLDSSITAMDIHMLRKQYPGIPIVCYVNVGADVMALCDGTCTVGNALDVIESFDSDTVIFLPDKFLAEYISAKTKKKIIGWHGTCVVHEQFTVDDIQGMKEAYNGDLEVIAHPECNPEIEKEVDFMGSTNELINYVENNKPKNVFVLTDCALANNLKVTNPETEFVSVCKMCPYMQQITLEKIWRCLDNEYPRVELTDQTMTKAKNVLEHMININPFNVAKGKEDEAKSVLMTKYGREFD